MEMEMLDSHCVEIPFFVFRDGQIIDRGVHCPA